MIVGGQNKQQTLLDSRPALWSASFEYHLEMTSSVLRLHLISILIRFSEILITFAAKNNDIVSVVITKSKPG